MCNNGTKYGTIVQGHYLNIAHDRRRFVPPLFLVPEDRDRLPVLSQLDPDQVDIFEAAVAQAQFFGQSDMGHPRGDGRHPLGDALLIDP